MCIAIEYYYRRRLCPPQAHPAHILAALAGFVSLPKATMSPRSASCLGRSLVRKETPRENREIRKVLLILSPSAVFCSSSPLLSFASITNVYYSTRPTCDALLLLPHEPRQGTGALQCVGRRKELSRANAVEQLLFCPPSTVPPPSFVVVGGAVALSLFWRPTRRQSVKPLCELWGILHTSH